MGVRRRCLPAGWYPGTAGGVRDAVEAMRGPSARQRNALAGVAPHAGWEFSGALACAVFASLIEGLDTIVIIGGHLAPSDAILAAFEEGYETPLGTVPADLDLLGRLPKGLRIAEDRWADNTVEVQLPFVRHFFPQARCLGLRAPPSAAAGELGRAIAVAARGAGTRVAVVGSTDLTHYGPNYGFSPKGAGEAALRWVEDVNDRRFIESLLAMDESGARERGVGERSACSAGGAIAAMSFAREAGADRGELLEHRTSRDVHPPGRESSERPSDSFVGYAAVVYRTER